MLKRLMLAGTALVMGSGLAQAVVIFNDNFNLNTIGANRVPTGWTLSGGAVDLRRTFAGQGVQVDMDSANSAAIARLRTQQTFNFRAGYTYTLSFSYGKRVNTNQYIGFGAGAMYSELTVRGASMAQMLQHAFTFVATSNFTSQLLFSGVRGNRAGVFIDNVQLDEVAPVPLPPAAMLLATGLFGISALGRRRDQ